MLSKLVPVLLSGEVTPTTLDLNFEPSQMFQYTNSITGALMPIVYISAGFALGFSIIYMLKNAFTGRI